MQPTDLWGNPVPQQPTERGGYATDPVQQPHVTQQPVAQQLHGQPAQVIVGVSVFVIPEFEIAFPLLIFAIVHPANYTTKHSR